MKRFMTVLAILATCVGILSFFAFDLPSRFGDWYYAVYLTPKVIAVKPSQWSTTITAQIVNNNPYPIYSVQLEISETNTGSNIDGVQIKPDSHILPTTFSTSTDMNAFVISGYSKLDGKKWKRSIVYQIDAHSTVNVVITIPATTIPEKFILRATDFGRDANPILQQQAATLVNFNIKD